MTRGKLTQQPEYHITWSHHARVNTVAEDVPSLAATPMGGNMLFIEVTDLDAVITLLGDTPVTFPRRTTFYGMNEIGVREPGGNAVTFAEKAQATAPLP